MAQRNQTRPSKFSADEVAAREIRNVAKYVARESAEFFKYGVFKQKKKLANGYTICTHIYAPGQGNR